MATETKHKAEERLARELADPGKRAAFLRERIEAIRGNLIRSHNKAFPDPARGQTSPASAGINRAIDDLSELIDIVDLAAHLAESREEA